MFELYGTDEYGVSYVAEAYETLEQAKSMLEEALGYAETPAEAYRIQGYLQQVYEELAYSED